MVIEKLKHFLKFVHHVLEKPGMFGVGHVNDLSLVFLGYLYSQSPDVVDVQELVSGFRVYVNEHFESDKNYDWYKLINLHSGSGIHSIQLFRNLFTGYLSEIGLSITEF